MPPKKRVVILTKRRKIRPADNIPSIVDPVCFPIGPSEGAKVTKYSALPQERVDRLVSGQGGGANHLAPVIDRPSAGIRQRPYDHQSSTESAKVLHAAVFPQEWVLRG